jgi:hypothetical protein
MLLPLTRCAREILGVGAEGTLLGDRVMAEKQFDRGGSADRDQCNPFIE